MWEAFWDWAWQRHHNVLSWYSRPLFLIPYVWFAHRRSVTGMLVTLAALATSMFWFPAPARVEPWVQEFLAAELDYLRSPWTAAKVIATLAVPAFLGLLAVAFWKRSWRWGVGVLVAGALGKLLWSVLEAGPSGWAIAAPALIGLAACVAAVLIGVRWRARRHPEGGRP